MCSPSVSLSIAARMAACDPPCFTFPESVTCRCRLMRLMDDGPVPGTMRTTSSRPTPRPRFEGTVMRASSSALTRNSSAARTRTSYSSSPALNDEATCPATSVFSAISISITETPRSAARGRSISSRTSGFPLRSVVSVSTRLGMVFISASIFSEYCASLSRSGPWMKYWTSALLWFPPTVLTRSTLV